MYAQLLHTTPHARRKMSISRNRASSTLLEELLSNLTGEKNRGTYWLCKIMEIGCEFSKFKRKDALFSFQLWRVAPHFTEQPPFPQTHQGWETKIQTLNSVLHRSLNTQVLCKAEKNCRIDARTSLTNYFLFFKCNLEVNWIFFWVISRSLLHLFCNPPANSLSILSRQATIIVLYLGKFFIKCESKH